MPPGALSEDALITLDTPTSDVMEVECGPDGIQFKAPVDLTISYADVDLTGIDEHSLVMLWLNPEANRWEVQAGTVDVAGKKVTAGLSHFSRYSLGGGASAKADKGRNIEKSMAQLEVGLSTQPNTLALEHLAQTTKQSLQDINPDIYRTVELGLELQDQKLVANGDEVVFQELVKNIDIYVYSDSWDAMQPQEKVDLINTTFRFLKRQYPKITPFVNLKFDDKRQDLNLKSLSVGMSN